MTRYSEMYRTEQEAHDLTTKKLIYHREHAAELLAFIQETGQQDAFCNWLVERKRVQWRTPAVVGSAGGQS